MTGTLNLQSLFCRRDHLSLPWREFILVPLFSSEFTLFFFILFFSLSCFFSAPTDLVNQNKVKVLFTLKKS